MPWPGVTSMFSTRRLTNSSERKPPQNPSNISCGCGFGQQGRPVAGPLGVANRDIEPLVDLLEPPASRGARLLSGTAN
ncbi:MAG: hypothetical protein IPN40_15685 [Uliginosibacterium sp.]|nr:hypothetical protein [Uliginosibacterium sp.]